MLEMTEGAATACRKILACRWGRHVLLYLGDQAENSVEFGVPRPGSSVSQSRGVVFYLYADDDRRTGLTVLDWQPNTGFTFCALPEPSGEGAYRS